MRDLTGFSTSEWLHLLPLQHALKQIRNDIWLECYKKAAAPGLDKFLQRTEHLVDKNIALVVAFEQPWALEWLLQMAGRHLQDTTVLVFDNSRRASARSEIERVCEKVDTPYLALPPNSTRHVNRSHGMAMTWIFDNVVRAIKPRIFGFIDHDLIPVARVDFSERLGTQKFFGLLGPGEDKGGWHLWAGYCLFDFLSVAHMPMNFLYDFSRGLDTGGRNWHLLYKNYDLNSLHFANSANVEIMVPATNEIRRVQFIDDRWLHIGGISYNNNFHAKSNFFAQVARALDEGYNWPQLCKEGVLIKDEK